MELVTGIVVLQIHPILHLGYVHLLDYTSIDLLVSLNVYPISKLPKIIQT